MGSRRLNAWAAQLPKPGLRLVVTQAALPPAPPLPDAVRRLRRQLAALAALFLFAAHCAAADDVLRIGSTRFTESYILGEILTQTAAPPGTALHLL